MAASMKGMALLWSRKYCECTQLCWLSRRVFAANGRYLCTTSKADISGDDQVAHNDEEFRVLVIPGHTQVDDTKNKERPKRRQVPPPRYQGMKTYQDWTNTWPTAHTFKWSAVPLPVRQGMAEGDENDGIPVGKYANAELMKIPNFLHLTPKHIKKHCAAIKKFCTAWPQGLETDEACERHMPMTTISNDYCTDGPSVRDPRARKVTLKIRLSSLELDYHARDKLQRLVGDRYDRATDMLTITADRCPMKKQNYEYLQYLLTALYYESWKKEPWEDEKAVADMEKYYWDISPSRKTVVGLVHSIKEAEAQQVSKSQDVAPDSFPEYTTSLPKQPDEASIVNLKPVQGYKEAVEQLHNEGENSTTLKTYKDSVKQLFNLKPDS